MSDQKEIRCVGCGKGLAPSSVQCSGCGTVCRGAAFEEEVLIVVGENTESPSRCCCCLNPPTPGLEEIVVVTSDVAGVTAEKTTIGFPTCRLCNERSLQGVGWVIAAVLVGLAGLLDLVVMKRVGGFLWCVAWFMVAGMLNERRSRRADLSGHVRSCNPVFQQDPVPIQVKVGEGRYATIAKVCLRNRAFARQWRARNGSRLKRAAALLAGRDGGR